jgi:putative glutamine amidotransferase
MLSPTPLIGVSTGFTDYGDYLGVAFTRPLVRLGAVPVVVPYIEDDDARGSLLKHLDGLLLGVGRDIEAWRFGATPHPSSTDGSPVRDETELALARAAIERGVPLLGICRGMQIINVALGGALHSDHSVLAPPANSHPGGDWERWGEVVQATLSDTTPPTHPSHPIETEPGSLIALALGPHAQVNSYHHQSLARLGAGVVATARAPDGVVEAIEVPAADAFCIGVQWELQESWEHGATGERLFSLLVDAARERSSQQGTHRLNGSSRVTSHADEH